MRVRLFAVVAVLLAASGVLGGAGPAPVAHAQTLEIPYGVASESYYRLDTATGTVSVRIHAEYINFQTADLPELPVWVMPGAQDIVVKAGDQVLEHKLTPGSEAEEVAGFALTTLPKPLKKNLKVTLDTTYTLGRNPGTLIHIEPGVIETPFIGQGHGSFVFIDAPKSGDNVFDPGCLLAAEQPGDVKDAGLERWVCGDVLLIALATDDADTLARCAQLDDRCRQRVEAAVFSAYVLSVSDETQRGVLESAVKMPDGREVTLTLKYFKRDSAWAQRQFDIATRAFPLLEQAFGFPYPFEQVTMHQSHHIEAIGAAGVAFSKTGDVLLATGTGVDDEVTIHELAHQWAGNGQLSKPWLWEGLAEWGTRVVAPQLGVSPRDWGWQAFGVNFPLTQWGSMLGGPPQYWYGRSGAFWFAYEEAIGGRENMTKVLSRIDDDPEAWRLQDRWFLDQGEWVGDRYLDQLFLEWVFNPETAKPLLDARRAARDQVSAMTVHALELGITGLPTDIYDNLIAWSFDSIPGQVARANSVLDSYAEVLRLSKEAGLGTPDNVAKSWGTTTLARTAVIVEDQRQAILSIIAATEQLASEPEGSRAKARLAEAHEKYNAGDFTGARASAAGGVTDVYNDVAAGKMIDLAKEKQAAFKAGFLGRVGMLFTDPAGDLAKAEAAYAAGDGAAALELSRSAYDTWDDASRRGIQRLAILAGLMAGLSFLVWFLLQRMDRTPTPKRLGEGHFIDVSDERRGSWRDWENIP
ncbi:MAG: hypothetical protein KJ048_03055 [Dehalococcoidia bacterium]|nr:hypothetical protein [Dehalococcoidia bacterium]